MELPWLWHEELRSASNNVLYHKGFGIGGLGSDPASVSLCISSVKELSGSTLMNINIRHFLHKVFHMTWGTECHYKNHQEQQTPKKIPKVGFALRGR